MDYHIRAYIAGFDKERLQKVDQKYRMVRKCHAQVNVTLSTK